MKLGKLAPSVRLLATGPAPLMSVGWSDNRRAPRAERGYGAEWDRLRLRILERDAYLCRCSTCTSTSRLRPASEVDHIISKAEWRISKGTLQGVDHPSNLQAINKECHKAKTQGEFRLAYARQTPGG